MKIIETTIGKNKAKVKLFLHEDAVYRVTPIICPGGGYAFTADEEGDPVALKFYQKGYNAAVLRYSTMELQLKNENPQKDIAAVKKKVLKALEQREEIISLFPQPLIDLAQTISYLEENREEFKVKGLFTVGFSAGANLVALYGVYWNQSWLNRLAGKDYLIKPAAQIVCYGYYDVTHLDTETLKDEQEGFTFAHGVLKAQYGTLKPSAGQLLETSPSHHLNEDVPPTFIWHTVEDKMVPVEEAVNFSKALNKNGVEWEMHIYSKGKHGLSLADESQKEKDEHVASWFESALSWLNYYF